LGYLGWKTIQHEKQLSRKSTITEHEAFLAYIEDLIKNTEKQRMSEIQDLLIRSSASASSKNYFFLATDLLESPIIQSVIILEKDELVMPGISEVQSNEFQNHTRKKEQSQTVKFLVPKIQETYRKGSHQECLNLIQRFLQNLNNRNVRGPLGTPYYQGFRLLQLNCLKQLGLEEQAIQAGSRLVDDMLTFQNVTDYRQWQFYLNEYLSALSSLENLSTELRDNLWSINIRSEAFFRNTHFVHNSWKPDIRFLAQIKGKDLIEGIQIFYLESLPYLKIRFPWIDSRSEVIARLNQSVFLNTIKSELGRTQTGPWKDIEYAVYNLNNVLIEAPFGLEGKQLVKERILNSQITQWKIALFRNPDNSTLAFEQRKILLMTVLLVFSLGTLLLGTGMVIRNLVNEQRIIRMKSNFLSAVTHELKTPLTSIRMLSEMVASGKQTSLGKIKSYAGHIGIETQRLHGMIENILNSARLDNRDFKIKPVPLNLNDVILETADIIKNAFQSRKIDLQLDLNKTPLIRGDKEGLRSVIQNLLDNALKYSEPGETVSVKTEESETGVQLIVKDEGIGIPPNALKFVFDKFYRAEDELTRRTKGSGLGLALVKQILDQHNARIWVKSKLDEGTEFSILFPFMAKNNA
jgi:signal transduction histidine kinase